MKRPMAIAWTCLGLLIGPFALSGWADSIHFGWGQCAEFGGTNDVVIPCDDPAEATVLYCTLDLTEPITDLVAIDLSVTVHADSEYWSLECGPDVTLGQEACWLQPVLPGANSGLSVGGCCGQGYIAGSLFIDATHPVDLAPGQYVAYSLTFRNPSAVEAGGSCHGCTEPATFGPPLEGGMSPPHTSIILNALSETRPILYDSTFTVNMGTALPPVPASSNAGIVALVILMVLSGVMLLPRSARV